MSDRYQITCVACSQGIAVSATQAGQITKCACGADVPVPTLLQLKKKPRLNTEVSARKSSWSPLNGYLFAIGFSLALIGSYLTYTWSWKRETLDISMPDFPDLPVNLDQITPTQAWDSWAGLNGLRETRLEFRQTPLYLAHRRLYIEMTHYLWFAWGLIAAGGILAAISFWLPSQLGSPTR